MRAVKALTLVIFSCGFSIYGQTSSPVDIYAGFVGTWIGSAEYPPKDVRIKQDVEIDCSETKKKDALKCRYTFGHKGEKNFGQAVHIIILDAVKGTYTSRWSDWWRGGSENNYRTYGLDTFAKTGKGAFSAFTYGLSPIAISNVIFDLEDQTFTYEWNTSSDGKTFVNYSTFSFTRAPNSLSTQH